MNRLILASFIIILQLMGVAVAMEYSDPRFGEQWWIGSNDEDGGANLEKAWNVVELNYRPKIAIIDTGFDIEHEEIKDSILINKGEIPDNGIDDDNNGYVDDYHGYNPVERNGNVKGFKQKHGTFIMGIYSAKHDNGLGIKGATDGFDLIPIIKHPFIGKNKKRLQKLVNAFEYAVARGADIINFSHRLNITSKNFEKIIQKAYKKNIIIVVSAGNDNLENAPNRYPGEYAKKYSNIIVVAASDPERVRSYFSNYGKTKVHLFAPGSKILSTLPENMYGEKNGTSFACPIVGATAALVLSTHGKKVAAGMRDRVIKTSRHFETLGGMVYSNGIIDAYSAITGRHSLNFIWTN